MATQTWTIKKNLFDLEYQKILTEYNNWLSAQFVLTLTVLGIAYQILHITHLGWLTLLGLFTFLFLEIGKRGSLSKLAVVHEKIRRL